MCDGQPYDAELAALWEAAESAFHAAAEKANGGPIGESFCIALR